MRLPPRLWIKRSLIVLGVVGLFSALVWTLWPKPVLVDVAEIRRGPLVVTVDDEGKTRIKDVYTVSAPITGKLVRLSLEAGDCVKKDVTTVASIEAWPPRSSMSVPRANWKRSSKPRRPAWRWQRPKSTRQQRSSSLLKASSGARSRSSKARPSPIAP